jgi:hypothetical protein
VIFYQVEIVVVREKHQRQQKGLTFVHIHIKSERDNMWKFLEDLGTGMLLFGILTSLATFLLFVEVGLTQVVVYSGVIDLVLMVGGWFIFEWGDRLHDKWLKQAYPQAWEQNQRMKEARKR